MTFSSHQVQSLSEAVKENYLGLMTTFIEHDEEKYQFLHLSIQEFLAAWWIAKQPNPEEIFDKHFHNDHFRMCLRFVAGVTNLSHESYEQYFDKPIDLQCKTKRVFGFDARYQSYFYTNPIIGHVHQFYFLTHVDHFPFPLLHLLYESQNTALCQTLALSIRHQSICLHALEFSLFDVLCLNFFLENVKTTWNHLHLMPLHQDELSVFTNVLITKRLDVHFNGINNDTIVQLINVQECYIEISDASLYTCNVLVQFLKFPQIKILHLKVEESIPECNMKVCCCSHLEKCFKDTSLQEVIIDLKQAKQFNPGIIEKISVHGENFLSVIIKGMCKNISITKFSIQLHHYHNSLRVPQDLMEQLFNENRTLNALSGNCLPFRSTIETVKTPLAALDITKDRYHINGLECISLRKLHPSQVINPSLVVTELMLNACESAIELFCILKNDVTLKSLRVKLTNNLCSSILFKSLCIDIQEMLQQNKTLECFEIDFNQSGIPPYTFLSCLITGLEGNNILQQLCLPIPISTQCMYSKVDHINSLFNVLSHKKNLTELQLEFEGHDTAHTIIATNDDTIFQDHILPLITDVLLSNKRIKQLSLNALFIKELKNENQWKKLFVAILNHPSLQYVIVKMHYFWIFEAFKSQIEHNLNSKIIIIDH